MPLRAGRPRATELRADWKLSISAKIAALVELELQDPLTKKAKYGARSELVEKLFTEWLLNRGIKLEASGVPDQRAPVDEIPPVPSHPELSRGGS